MLVRFVADPLSLSLLYFSVPLWVSAFVCCPAANLSMDTTCLAVKAGAYMHAGPLGFSLVPVVFSFALERKVGR
jgi:hypothetical protein